MVESRGVFETIRISEGKCEFLERHLSRMAGGLKVLGMDGLPGKDEIKNYIKENSLKNCALRIAVSDSGTDMSDRPIQYSAENYAEGFSCTVSSIIRDRDSPLTYVKSLDNSVNLVQRAEARKKGFDEAIFLNSEGQVCEGTSTNIFFVGADGIVTPELSCGMLPGIIREVIIERFGVQEAKIHVSDFETAEGCFLTNSLMGVMPVRSIGNHTFDRGACKEIMNRFDVTDKEKI